MLRVTIRELHLRTGEWIRRIQTERRVIVTDRGRPIATLIPYEPEETSLPFGQRRLLPEFETLPPVQGDVTAAISEDRDRA